MAAERLSDPVITALRSADRRIRSAPRDDNLPRYEACRLALSSLTRVTSFYVGLYRDEETLVIPYSFDEGQVTGVSLQHFGPHGLSDWMRTGTRTYRWAQDQGALIRRGLTWGGEAPTQDALVTPIREPSAETASGFMAFLSDTPDVFTDELEAAADWLARALAGATVRDREELADLDLYALYPELDTSATPDEEDLLLTTSEELGELGEAAAAVLEALHEGRHEDAAKLTRGLRETAYRARTQLLEQFATQSAEEEDALDELTEREREIAVLIAEHGLTNAQIAERLVISERTVKGHVGNILRKMELTQRSGIAWVLSSGGPPAEGRAPIADLRESAPSATQS